MSATDEIKNYYLSLGIKESVYDFCEATEQALLPRFQEIDRIAEQNQIKVISAMQKAGFSESHLNGTTGYGYNDRGRDLRPCISHRGRIGTSADYLWYPCTIHCPVRKFASGR